MNFSNMKQALQLKAQLDKVQKELAKLTVETDAGHGAVKVTMNGQQKVVSVTISPEALDPDKIKRLEENIARAVNDAVEKSQKVAAKQLAGLTGGLKIPGLT